MEPRSPRDKKSGGQAIVEYAIAVGLIVAAILGMQVYAKRGIQAGVKGAADQLSPFADDPTGEKAQLEGMRYESGERRNRATAAPGGIDEKYSTVTTRVDRTVNEQDGLGGSRRRQILDRTSASGTSFSKVVVEKR
jgi:Flp pilus assembly pilin Flp